MKIIEFKQDDSVRFVIKEMIKRRKNITDIVMLAYDNENQMIIMCSDLEFSKISALSKLLEHRIISELDE